MTAFRYLIGLQETEIGNQKSEISEGVWFREVKTECQGVLTTNHKQQTTNNPLNG
jgi:hypothetical protein